MNDVLSRLLSVVESKTGAPLPVRGTSKLAQIVRRRGVGRTAELERVLSLPRRDWREGVEELRPYLEDWLHTPGGATECGHCWPRCATSLKPDQIAVLRDAHDVGGIFGPITVGSGKTLMALLVPVVLEAKRPVLFVRASLKPQMERDYLTYGRHWRMHPRLQIVSYELLSRRPELLDQLDPDLIVMDECHRVSDPKTGRTKRLRRYMRAHPETSVVAVSGSVANRSIMRYHHLLEWTLKSRLMPLPSSWREAQEWADALDEDVEDERRLAPGALEMLGGTSVLDGYRSRLAETPGVICTSGGELDCSLEIRAIYPEMPRASADALQQLRDTWELPRGDMLTEPFELWRHAREMALGFYYVWDPPAPIHWLEARREWQKHVAEVLKNNRRGIDTELMVAQELDRGGGDQAEGREVLAAWRAVRDEFVPNPVPVWMDDDLARLCIEWARENTGVVWVEHVAFGRRLAELGLRYFGGGDNGVTEHRGPCAASIAAHGEGKNLQQWCRALISSPQTTGRSWEQLLGRHHREGQPADEVTFEVLLHVDELVKGFQQACSDARWMERTTGNRQRLNYADVVGVDRSPQG